ncbi:MULTISPECIES: hypothetical protein [unclassified Yoonia]|uniref:hypothetical protein n=1 Tax=unclassified Yoonia TaxID=2629118 RepID=UPI002AFF04B3|nr:MULTISPECIES: hypothetical protein [unclassified Yoonia]
MTPSGLTDEHYDLLKRVMNEDLGLLRGIHVSNRTCIDFAVCFDLVWLGLMKRLDRPSWVGPYDHVFQVTPDGRDAVANSGEIQ